MVYDTVKHHTAEITRQSPRANARPGSSDGSCLIWTKVSADLVITPTGTFMTSHSQSIGISVKSSLKIPVGLQCDVIKVPVGVMARWPDASVHIA